ncbi:MAG: acyltransferase [Ignavibacteria bacterium]|nr:acyltransferase [Ignavibacteria bacterium]
MIAYGVVIHTSTHDYNCHPMWTKHIMRPVKIGKYVWIGTGAIILPGVIIKDHAVIAAGSVVNANVPEGAIVAGNPARIVKYRDPSIYKNKLPIIENRSEAEIINDTYLSNNCKLR